MFYLLFREIHYWRRRRAWRALKHQLHDMVEFVEEAYREGYTSDEIIQGFRDGVDLYRRTGEISPAAIQRWERGFADNEIQNIVRALNPRDPLKITR